jgi:hypothetical protein
MYLNVSVYLKSGNVVSSKFELPQDITGQKAYAIAQEFQQFFIPAFKKEATGYIGAGGMLVNAKEVAAVKVDIEAGFTTVWGQDFGGLKTEVDPE